MLDELEDEMLFLDEVNRRENLTLDNITLEVNDNQSLTQVTIKKKQITKQKNITLEVNDNQSLAQVTIKK